MIHEHKKTVCKLCGKAFVGIYQHMHDKHGIDAMPGELERDADRGMFGDEPAAFGIDNIGNK